jgi:hypothetical protein
MVTRFTTPPGEAKSANILLCPVFVVARRRQSSAAFLIYQNLENRKPCLFRDHPNHAVVESV